MINNEVVIKSSIASAMGARISVTGPQRGTYLVIGSMMQLESLVKSAGGQVVLRLNGGKMLVTLPFSGYLSLRGNYHISHIGPVTIDIRRLTKLVELLSRTSNSGPGSAG